MNDLTPTSSRMVPLVESAVQRNALRVALVHAPSSAQQARELKDMLESKGVETVIVNVSFIAASFEHEAATLRTSPLTSPPGSMAGVPGRLARHVHRERA